MIPAQLMGAGMSPLVPGAGLPMSMSPQLPMGVLPGAGLFTADPGMMGALAQSSGLFPGAAAAQMPGHFLADMSGQMQGPRQDPPMASPVGAKGTGQGD